MLHVFAALLFAPRFVVVRVAIDSAPRLRSALALPPSPIWLASVDLGRQTTGLLWLVYAFFVLLSAGCFCSHPQGRTR